jgi:prophage maintenance system killer protein
VFYLLNGQELLANMAALVSLTIDVAEGILDIDKIAGILKENTK